MSRSKRRHGTGGQRDRHQEGRHDALKRAASSSASRASCTSASRNDRADRLGSAESSFRATLCAKSCRTRHAEATRHDPRARARGGRGMEEDARPCFAAAPKSCDEEPPSSFIDHLRTRSSTAGRAAAAAEPDASRELRHVTRRRRVAARRPMMRSQIRLALDPAP